MLTQHQISSHTVRASTTLTDSYVAGTVFSADEANHLNIGVNYTKGDETQLDLKIEGSNDGGSTYFQQVGESTSTGVTTVSLGSRKFTATGKYSIEVTPIRAKLIKISVKKQGGSSPGSVAITAFASWA